MMQEGGNTPFSTGEPTEVKDLCKKHKIDVVLLDVNMPKKNGIDVCKEIHALDADIPVIMISGITDETIQRKTIASGAIDFISKPFEAINVLIRVQNAVRMHHMRSKLNHQQLEIREMSQQFSEQYSDLKELALDREVIEGENRASDFLAEFFVEGSEVDE